MIQTLRSYLYKGYDIFTCHDTGAVFYCVEKDKEFIGNFDTAEEAEKEIDERIGKA